MQAQETNPLLDDLTETQRAAVVHTEGPLLIIAGAGSGKTRVLTRRVGYLLDQGIEPAAILAITFTNKAAGEMKHRIGQLRGRPLRDFGRLDQPWPMVCTFHSLGLRILRFYAPLIGLPENFTIFDSSDQQKLIKEAIKMLDLSTTNFSPSAIHGTISNAKNQLLTAKTYEETAGDFYRKTVARVYTKYEQLLTASNGLDFDDLLLRTAHAMRDHPILLNELQQRFGYILIDEYQDTNHAQYIIAHAMAQKHRNICVVGDPDQSIYAWRGADLRNILDFEKDYPDATVVKLEQNYRSTKTILSIASGLIANNQQRRKKDLWTENEQGAKAELYQCQNEKDEAQLVVERFKALHDEQKIDWGQMAVFYRMNALSRVMEDAMRRANVPYVMARGVEFYNRKVIKDVLAYMRVISNPADEISLTRIINTPPRGIGAASVKQLQVHAVGNGISLWQALHQADKVPGISTRGQKSIAAFVAMIKAWQKKAQKLETAPTTEKLSSEADTHADRDNAAGDPVHAAGDNTIPETLPLLHASAANEPDAKQDMEHDAGLRALMEEVVRKSGLEADLRKSRKEADRDDDPMENVNELISSAADFEHEMPQGSLADYLATVSLVADADRMENSGGSVTLMTLHSAKGLEFPVVAIIGLEEGTLPHARARDNPDQMEEERRLCFVGITRAQKYLILTKSAYRTIRGLRERMVSSPFLAELPKDQLVVTDRTGLDFEADQTSEYDAYSSHSHRLEHHFKRGQLVRHPQFGLGRILDVSDIGTHTRAAVQFNQVGRKTLILQYAHLEPVDTDDVQVD